MNFGQTKSKKVFELPANEQSYLQELKARVGILATCAVQCLLCGQTTGLHNLHPDELKIVRDLATVYDVQRVRDALPPE